MAAAAYAVTTVYSTNLGSDYRSHTINKMTLTPMGLSSFFTRWLVQRRRSGHWNSMHHAGNYEVLQMRPRAHTAQ